MLALLALAGLVRVSAMYWEAISGDDATVPLIAKHVLSGENLPVLFYPTVVHALAARHPHMGPAP